MTKAKQALTEKEFQTDGITPEIGPTDLSKAIRFHRRKSGLSQLELSKLAGVGKTVVFDLEKNKQTMQLDTLLKVLHALNIAMVFQSPLMKQFLLRKSQ